MIASELLLRAHGESFSLDEKRRLLEASGKLPKTSRATFNSNNEKQSWPLVMETRGKHLWFRSSQ